MSQDGLLTTKEAALKLGITHGRVRQLCSQGRIEGAELASLGRMQGWMIPDPPVILGTRQKEGFLGTGEAAKVMNLTRQRVVELCKGGLIEGATFENNRWYIPVPIKRIRKDPGRKQAVATS